MDLLSNFITQEQERFVTQEQNKQIERQDHKWRISVESGILSYSQMTRYNFCFVTKGENGSIERGNLIRQGDENTVSGRGEWSHAETMSRRNWMRILKNNIKSNGNDKVTVFVTSSEAEQTNTCKI